jgi:hypothetical protein
MKVDFHFLADAPTETARKYINFFNTFGYLHITNAFNSLEARKSRKEYMRIYEEANKKKWKHMMRSGVQFFIPNFYEESEYFLDNVLAKKIYPLAKLIANDTPIYLGSDGSCFNGQSFSWHRDWFAKSRMLKFNIYMNSGRHFGGRHLLIPGSQFTEDEFSQSIGMGGAWPFKPRNYGWLNEDNYFPETPDPREHFLKRKAKEFLGRNYLPYVGIKPSPNDILLFDQRTWHMVEKPFPSIPQMLATALFAVHPSSNYNEYIHGPHKKEELQIKEELTELAALYAGERRMCKCSNYGKEYSKLKGSEILHFVADRQIYLENSFKDIEVRLSDNTFRVKIDAVMEKYAKTAKDVRALNAGREDGYTDEMLGINFANISNYFKGSLEKPGSPKETRNLI